MLAEKSSLPGQGSHCARRVGRRLSLRLTPPERYHALRLSSHAEVMVLPVDSPLLDALPCSPGAPTLTQTPTAD
jgi:hypothetical protein